MMLLVCSGNEAVRKKWSAALQDKFTVHQAAAFSEIIPQFKSLPIDLLLVHRSMADEKQLREICVLKEGSRVFVFSDRPNDMEGSVCLKVGCVGYANTYISSARLLLAVEAVISGLAWVGKSLIQHIVQEVAAEAQKQGQAIPAAGNSVTKDLSPREKEIAHLVAGGLQNYVIGEKLGITERTVKAHLSAIYSKTGTNGRLALALRINRGT